VNDRKTVLFACVHNAGRSQIAAALFNRLADPGKARATSAGTHPGSAIHPEVLTVLREDGIELGQERPRLLTPEIAREASWLITMGCGEECPVVPGAKRDDWPLPDPKGQRLAVVRELRDAIRARVEQLILREGWGRRSP
jgi:arsenate reductase (thioredoxin)